MDHRIYLSCHSCELVDGNAPGIADTALQVYPVVLSHQHYTSAVHGVYGAYCAFFEDIRIRNGWQEIPFTKEDLAPIFRVCAEICSVLRAR